MINFSWTFNIQNTVPYDVNTQNSNVIKTLGWVIIGTDSEYTNKCEFIPFSYNANNLKIFDAKSLPL